jgi:hypothetical protein
VVNCVICLGKDYILQAHAPEGLNLYLVRTSDDFTNFKSLERVVRIHSFFFF